VNFLQHKMRRDEYFSAVLLEIITSQIWDICDFGTSINHSYSKTLSRERWVQ